MRCKICKAKFEAKYFNQKTCFNPTCIIEYSRQQNEKENKKKLAQLRKEEKEYRIKKNQTKKTLYEKKYKA